MIVVYNTAVGYDETIEAKQSTRSWFNFTVPQGKDSTKPYSFSIAHVRLWNRQFLLLKDGDFSCACREIYVWIRIK